MAAKEWYERFRWFMTSSGKIVIGGKSAEQNEDVVKNYIDKEDIILHTALPGSPFLVIKSEGKNITEDDVKEAAILCASFSQQWKKGMKKTEIHVFTPSQIFKSKGDRKGTFNVSGSIRKIQAELKLVLTIQNGILRAVPESAAGEKIMTILPGRIKKDDASRMIKEKLGRIKLSSAEQEILQALPAGGFNLK